MVLKDKLGSHEALKHLKNYLDKYDPAEDIQLVAQVYIQDVLD
jgi:hypothetical protein